MGPRICSIGIIEVRKRSHKSRNAEHKAIASTRDGGPGVQVAIGDGDPGNQRYQVRMARQKSEGSQATHSTEPKRR